MGDADDFPTQQAPSFNMLLHFISNHGPGIEAFATAMDSQFRSAGIKNFKTTAPTKLSEHDLGNAWAEIMRCQDIDFQRFVIGREVYEGPADGSDAQKKQHRFEWWAGNGDRLIKALIESAEGRQGGRNYSKDELRGHILTQKECVVIHKSSVFSKLAKAVDDENLSEAQRHISKDKKAAALLRRGLIGIKHAETLKIPEKQTEKSAVYDTLFDMNTLIAYAIKGKIHSLFPLRKLTPLAFAESVRDALATIDDPENCIIRTLALLLECDTNGLSMLPYATIQPALRAVGELWQLHIGTAYMGEQVARNLASPLVIWAQGDSQFVHWPDFAKAERLGDNPVSLIKRIVVYYLRQALQYIDCDCIGEGSSLVSQDHRVKVHDDGAWQVIDEDMVKETYAIQGELQQDWDYIDFERLTSMYGRLHFDIDSLAYNDSDAKADADLFNIEWTGGPYA
eukprot:SAG11_NODE_380_length_9956_cov_6.339454_4_plen_453_part_00